MTCIAGIVDKDGSVMVMADSAASSTGSVWVQKDYKVWRHGELVLGFCGSFRGRDILMSSLTLPSIAEDMDPEYFMRTGFVKAVREVFRENGFLAHFGEGNDQSLSAVMVGLRGRLFLMRNDFSIGESVNNYMAVGSGAPEALGSLYSTRQWTDAKARLVEALGASTYFNAGSVQPPYHFVTSQPWPTS